MITLPPRRPRILLTTARALAIVTCCYGCVAYALHVLILYVEHYRGVPDPHRDLVVGVGTLVWCFAWAWSVIAIVRARLVHHG